MVIKEINAVGEHVILKAIECEEQQEEHVTESGIIMLAEEQKSGQKVNKVNNNGKVRVKLIVHSIGPGVDAEKYNIKIGDEVICNDLDIQTLGDDEGTMFGITRAQSIRCVVKSDD